MTMHRSILFAAALLACCFSLANAQTVFKIYDGKAPGSETADYPEFILPTGTNGHPMVYNVTEPTVTVYRPDAKIDTKTAVIIAPGGGNMYLTWEEEGTNVAEWFQRHGVTGIILKYRTNYMGVTEDEIAKNVAAFRTRLRAPQRQQAGPAPQAPQTPQAAQAPRKLEPTIQGDDGRQAVKWVRAHAAELDIDPHKIGLIGFSAGGMLTCNVLAIHDADSRPDFVAPIYGPVDTELPPDPMPAFICGPEFDLFPPDAACNLYRRFQQAHLPAELHFITDASHGEGLLYNGRQWNDWIDLLFSFMKATHFVE